MQLLGNGGNILGTIFLIFFCQLLSEFELFFQRSVVHEMKSGFKMLSYVILNFGEADEVAEN